MQNKFYSAKGYKIKKKFQSYSFFLLFIVSLLNFSFMYYTTNSYAQSTGITTAHQYAKEGLQNLQTGDIQEAIDNFESATQLNPDNLEWKLYLADAYVMSGQVQKAMDIWQSILRKQPDHPIATKKLLAINNQMKEIERHLLYIESLIDYHLFSKAKDECIDGLNHFTDSEHKHQYYYLLIKILPHLRQSEEALAKGFFLLKNVQNDNEFLSKVTLEMGRTYSNFLDQPEKAIECFNKTIRLLPNTYTAELASLEKGWVWIRFDHNQLHSALEVIEQFINSHPNEKDTVNALFYHAKGLLMLSENFPLPVTTTKPLIFDDKAFQSLCQLLAHPLGFGDRKEKEVYDLIVQLVQRYNQPSYLQISVNFLEDILTKNQNLVQYHSVLTRLLMDYLIKLGHMEFSKMQATEVKKEELPLNLPHGEAVKTALSLIVENPDQADYSLDRIQKLIQFYQSNGYWPICEQIRIQMQNALPPAYFPEQSVALIQLYMDWGIEETEKLIRNSLSFKNQISPPFQKAFQVMKKLVTQQMSKSVLKSIQHSIFRMANFYISYQAYSTVEQMAVLLESNNSATPLADTILKIRADNNKIQGLQQLNQEMQLYEAGNNQQINQHLNSALQLYQSIIDKYPHSDFLTDAFQQIVYISNQYLNHKVYDVAEAIYQLLSKNNPDWARTDEMEYLMVKLHWMQALDEFIEEKEQNGDAPSRLSDNFEKALTGILQFLKNNSKSQWALKGLIDIQEMILLYAKEDRWDIVIDITKQMNQNKDLFLYPEAVMLIQAMGYLGYVMPSAIIESFTRIKISLERQTGYEVVISTEGSLSTTPVPVESTSDIMESTTEALFDKIGYYENEKLTDSIASQEQMVMYDDADITAIPPAPPESTTRDNVYGGSPAIDQTSIALSNIELQRAASLNELQVAMNNNNRSPGSNASVVSPGNVSESEWEKRNDRILSAYHLLNKIITDYPNTETAKSAQEWIKKSLQYYINEKQWQGAIAYTTKIIQDNPRHPQLPELWLKRANYAMNYARFLEPGNRQQAVKEIEAAFQQARTAMLKLSHAFTDETNMVIQAKYQIAFSHYTEAQRLDNYSISLAKGKYLKSAYELLELDMEYPQAVLEYNVPRKLIEIGGYLQGKTYWSELLEVYELVRSHYPVYAETYQLGKKMADIYNYQLNNYLKAVEAYQEFLAISGANNQSIQNLIFNIGKQLKDEKRWVESLHVLKTFVNNFPNHNQADMALRLTGDIHKANQAWEDAIKAYKQVRVDYPKSHMLMDVQWEIADCHINLSNWQITMDIYQAMEKGEIFIDETIPEQLRALQQSNFTIYNANTYKPKAKQRISILKDIIRFQDLVDNDVDNRKRDDAQYQIAMIVRDKLNNPVKAIIEFGKVVENYPSSHQADDAQYAIGLIYLELDRFEEAREALTKLVQKYPESPLSGDALYYLGQSYEEEANMIETITFEEAEEEATERAQSQAYELNRSEIQRRMDRAKEETASLRSQFGDLGNEMGLTQSAAGERYELDNVLNIANEATQQVKQATALELANREDKVNAALRKAIQSYQKATSDYPLGSMTDEALLRMAEIYQDELKNTQKAMEAYQTIVKYFQGTAIAEDASWKIANFHYEEQEYEKAIESFKQFIRNYQGSQKLPMAQFSMAECFEKLGMWVEAMDAYTVFIDKFSSHALVQKAKEQINWIKAYRL